MARGRATPTTRQRELAERLRDLRLDRGLTVEAVANRLMVSPSKISRLETANRRPSPRDVRDLCNLYGVSADERERLLALASQALETAWYQDADLDVGFKTFIGLEGAASAIDTLQTTMIPGLLQTARYARILVAGIRAPAQMAPDRLEETVFARCRRQEVMSGDNPPRLHAIVDETAIRRPVGPADVMAEQVDAILEATSAAHVTVQLIPFDAGAHPGLDGRFTVLRFGDDLIRDVVFVEGLLGELFLDKDHDVDRYLQTFRYVAEQVALDETRSRKLLDAARADWRSR